jgi:hypothetical protein
VRADGPARATIDIPWFHLRSYNLKLMPQMPVAYEPDPSVRKSDFVGDESQHA